MVRVLVKLRGGLKPPHAGSVGLSRMRTGASLKPARTPAKSTREGATASDLQASEPVRPGLCQPQRAQLPTVRSTGPGAPRGGPRCPTQALVQAAPAGPLSRLVGRGHLPPSGLPRLLPPGTSGFRSAEGPGPRQGSGSRTCRGPIRTRTPSRASCQTIAEAPQKERHIVNQNIMQ